jgi:dienelactone hydrolase
MTTRRYLALALLAACTSEPTGTTIAMHATAAVPEYGSVPFPTDALREGDHLATLAGLDKIVGHHTDLVAAHLAALDGYGLRPLVEMFVDGGDLDADSIPVRTTDRSEPAALVDVDPDSPERGRVIAMDWHYDADRHVLSGSPASGEVLREGTRYAAYITTALRTAGGSALARPAALDDLAGSAPERWRSTADAMRELAEPDLAGIAAFTTQHATAPLLAARAAMDDRTIVPAPVLAFPDPSIIFSGQTALDQLLGHATRATDGTRIGLERWGYDNATGIAHDHVGVIGTGTITIARFRGDDVGTNGPEDKSFQIDPATGVPRLIAIDTIPITFILPAAPPPPAGYPTIIYGHGLGASRDAMEAFAEPLTSQGYAVVGIDMFGHGSRFDPTDHGNNLAGKPGFTGDPNLRDGFGDTTGAVTQFHFFEGFLDVSAVRDSIRQSSLDLGRVVEALHASDLDLSALGANAKLDTRRIAYLGESFGTVVGTLFSAIEPDVDLFVLDVPGGGILDLLLPASPEIGGVALPYIETIYNPLLTVDRWNPLIALQQAVVDGGDPLSYAPHVLSHRFSVGARALGPRSVVAIEVVGDQVLSNLGTEALARELGLDVLTPDLAPPAGLTEIASPASGNRDGQTAVLVQYAPATHGANWCAEHGTLNYLPGFPQPGGVPFPKLPAPITIQNPIYATYDQVDEILATHFAGAAPTVRSTLAPVADFDDDGTPDSADAYPYDPTRH